MNDARLAANVKAEAEPGNVVAVYRDGVILYLAVAEDTARAVSQVLGEHVSEYGTSDDGMFHCWVCRGLTLDEAGVLLAPEREWLEIGLSDNRFMDAGSITEYLALMRRVKG